MSTRPAERILTELAQERRAIRRDLLLTGVTGSGLALGIIAALASQPLLAGGGFLLAYLTGGVPTSVRALSSLRRGRVDIDLLMMLAALAAAAVGEARDGAILLLLFQAAETAEAYAMGSTRRAVAGLMELRPDRARLLQDDDPDGDGRQVAVEEVPVGALLRVLPGERIPLDGRVDAGTGTIDASAVTGEAYPLEREPGDPVFAGAVNGHAALRIRTTATASTSTLARMVDAVSEAQRSRAPAERIGSWFGRRYTPWVLVGTASAFALFLATGATLQDAGYRAATLLVVASPCAVVISVPAAVLAALAAASRGGVLFKDGAVLAAFARTQAFLFDKTGTLTEGRMVLAGVQLLSGDGTDEREALRIAAALEAHSEHPLAQAVVRAAKERSLAVPVASEVRALPGFGLSGRVADRRYWLGTERLAQRWGVPLSSEARNALRQVAAAGRTPALLGLGSDPTEPGAADEPPRLVALLAIEDRMRASAPAALAALRSQGVQVTALVTGDRPEVAAAVAARVAIPAAAVHAGLLPEDKVRVVSDYRRQGAVAYLGDGVNDAAALATADVGVAMGVAGSDVALEAADVALLADDLTRLPAAHRLALRTRRVLRQNLAFALAVMAGMVAWTLIGDVPLPLAVVAHEGGTLLVVANGMRLLRRDAGDAATKAAQPAR